VSAKRNLNIERLVPSEPYTAKSSSNRLRLLQIARVEPFFGAPCQIRRWREEHGRTIPLGDVYSHFVACNDHVAAHVLGNQKYLESRSTVDSVPIRSKLALSH
jgi:hypothetical protein